MFTELFHQLHNLPFQEAQQVPLPHCMDSQQQQQIEQPGQGCRVASRDPWHPGTPTKQAGQQPGFSITREGY